MLLTVKEPLDPSVQSYNNLTIIDQIIVLDAPVSSHLNSFWRISLTSTDLHHCYFNGYFPALVSVLMEESGGGKQTSKHRELY